MQEFKTDISVNGNQVKNIIIDQKDNFPPVSESYEGRKITLNGISYIFHNGAWQSVAEDLEGRNESHEEEFVFQPTANDLSVKDGFAKIEKIKGTTFLWNQRMNGREDSDFVPINNSYGSTVFFDDYVRLTSIAGGNVNLNGYKDIFKDYKQGDLFLLSLFVRPITACTMLFGELNNYLKKTFTESDLNKWFHCVGVFTKNVIFSYGPCLVRFSTLIGSPDRTVDIRRDIVVVNLTKLSAGGINVDTYERFNSLFPNTPYNVGELISLNPLAIKTVGFNAYNGEYAKVLGGQTYYLNGEYSSLGFTESIDSEVVKFDLPADRLYTPATNGYIVAKGNNICINLSHTGFRNGEYLPYMDYNLSFDFVKSIKDSNNNLLFSDGELCSVGDVADEIYTISDKHYKAIKRIGKRAYQSGDENLEKAITDKTNTLYVLDTPIESEIFEKELSYFEWDFGTEEIIPDQEDENTPTVPIRADIQYIFNAVDMIRNNYYLILEILKRLPKNINLDFWSLVQANAEVDACEVSINNSTESVFPKILERYDDYIHSRNIIVDLSNYSDSSNYILDIFGDITNVPTGIRYSIFLYGYGNSLKIDFPLTYKTNITATHSSDGMSEERYTIAYSGATKIDFIKLSNDLVWVDVS